MGILPHLKAPFGIPVPSGKAHGNASNSTPSNRTAPKSRRAQSARDRIFNALPASSGAYDVGSIDLEVAVISEDFGIIRDGKPLLVMDTVLFTIFYPIKLGSGAMKAPDGKKEWSRQLWLTANRGKMSRGYGEFSGVNKPFCQVFFTSTVGLTKLPAWRNAPLAEHFPAEGNVHECGPEIRDREAKHPLQRNPIFPLLLFSHGLGGTRTTYSSICGEYASYGWICVAVEHRDGSGPRTFVNYPDGRRPRVVEYIHPIHGNDTVNDADRVTDHELRDAQLRMRKREIDEVHKLMTMINEGKGAEVGHRNLRVKPLKNVIGGSSRGTLGVEWAHWKNRMQINNVTMCGHSFGAATTICVLKTPKMLEYIKYGIILDIWGQGLPEEPLADEQKHLGTPLLAMMSESFLYWEENLDIIFQLTKSTALAGHKVWLFTIRGSFHLSFSDFGVLYPKLFKLLFKTNIPAQRVLDIIINASLEYFREVMPPAVNRWNRGTNEGILKTRLSNKWRTIEGKKNAWRQKMQLHGGDDTEVWMHYAHGHGDGERSGNGAEDEKDCEHDFSGIAHHRIEASS